jgi:hypothetical protein
MSSIRGSVDFSGTDLSYLAQKELEVKILRKLEKIEVYSCVDLEVEYNAAHEYYNILCSMSLYKLVDSSKDESGNLVPPTDYSKFFSFTFKAQWVPEDKSFYFFYEGNDVLRNVIPNWTESPICKYLDMLSNIGKVTFDQSITFMACLQRMIRATLYNY